MSQCSKSYLWYRRYSHRAYHAGGLWTLISRLSFVETRDEKIARCSLLKLPRDGGATCREHEWSSRIVALRRADAVIQLVMRVRMRRAHYRTLRSCPLVDPSKRKARADKGAFAESNVTKLRASRSGKRKACGRNVKRARARGENSTQWSLTRKVRRRSDHVWPQRNDDESCKKDARSATVRGRCASRQIALSAFRRYIVQRTERHFDKG